MSLEVRITCPNCSSQEDNECTEYLNLEELDAFLFGHFHLATEDIPIAEVEGMMQLAKQNKSRLVVVRVGESFDIWIPSPQSPVLEFIDMILNLL